MAIPTKPSGAVVAALPTGPPSEREFVRALRDCALVSVDLAASSSVRGLTPSSVRGLTPTELEEQSGLSRPPVTSLIRRFAPILQGQDLDGRPVNRSDPIRRWAIDPAAGAVIGVEIGYDYVRVAVSDLYGRIERDGVLEDLKTADESIEKAVEQIRELLGERSVSDVVGVGVSLAAPVERERGVTRAASPTANGTSSPWVDWQLMKVREQFRARLGWEAVPILLDNDANVSALAEYVWGAARPPRLGDRPPYKNVVYLEWSHGIGAGLIVGGELYRGEGGVAGEIGHTVVREGADALPCKRCGNKGCLETVAGLDAISKKNLATAVRLAQEQPNSSTAKAFRNAAREVGRVLGPAIHFLNPDLVIVGGDLGNSAYQVIRTPLLESLKRYTMRPALADVTIVPAKLGDYTALRGSVALVLRQSQGDPDRLLAFLQRKASG